MDTTQVDFQAEVLNSELPVLVDFTAAWCGPCKMVAPIVSELATEYEGRAKVLAIDVDAQVEVASQYGIMSIPALVMFKGGQEVDRIVGAAPKQEIAGVIDRHL